MANATVVDQLIVKLGLDPKDFDKGTKRAAADVVEVEKTVKKSSQSMSRDLVGVAGKMLGVATAAIAVKKVLSYVSDLSTDIRRLGIDSRNFGIAAAEMRNFQNIGEMFGGKAEEVTRSIGGITKAVYDLAYNGQISDSLVMLGRLGVRFQDTAGNARDFKDIVLDTEAAIQRSMANGTSRENANQMLQQAGFDPGLTQAMLAGQVGAQLARQGERRQVDSATVSAATAWEQSATNRDQAVAAAALRGLPVAAAGGAAVNNAAAAAADYAGTASVGTAVSDLGNAAEAAATKIEAGVDRMVDGLEEAGRTVRSQLWVKGRANYENTIQSAAAKYGINPELLAGVLETESNFNPAAKNASGATGIAQLMPKYFPNAGKNPHEDIDTAAAYLQALRDSFLKEGNDEAASNYLALQSYNAGQSRVRNSADMGGKGPPLKQETLDYPGKVLGYAAGAIPTPNAQGGAGGSSTSTKTDVSIGNVTVNTQATDADGIARDFGGAVKRKMTAAQADIGMQ